MKRIFLLVVFSAFVFGTSFQTGVSASQSVHEENVPPVSADSPGSLSTIPEKIRKGFLTPYLNFGGYGKLMYDFNDDAEVKHNLKPRVVFLWMEGKLGVLRYYMLAEFAKPTLTEYHVEWHPSRAFKLRAGQQKVPFTFENQLSLTRLETAVFSRTISSLAGMADDAGVKTGGRDIGITASGEFFELNGHSLIGYSLGFFQGAGINTSDNNNVKDFAATLKIHPLPGMRLGYGLYAGQARYSMGGEQPLADHVRNRQALSFDYERNRFFTRLEYLKGNDGGVRKEGVYGLALWYFKPEKLNGLLKMDFFNADKNLGLKSIDYTLGMNYYFAPMCRVELNYIHTRHSDNHVGTLNKNRVIAELQIVF